MVEDAVENGAQKLIDRNKEIKGNYFFMVLITAKYETNIHILPGGIRVPLL